jgi:ABC-type polysaccharide/polyol phosphate transport system ATPase subunit
MAPIIEIEHLRKVYQLRTVRGSTLKEMLLVNLWQPNTVREHVALEDVSFAIERGQTLGIMGNNGSGKSTLLRILAGIAEPTSGRVAVHGKASSLIDLTAGLQPELNGYENIFFNASILGLPRSEIRRRMLEIVDFAELGDYIHTPVKYYSTGMLVRLAFSISVHLDPEILLVDEALAVGDMYFQAKSLDRMRRLRRERNTTILMVTHDAELVDEFADQMLWLNFGKQVYFGPKSEGIDRIVAEHHRHVPGYEQLDFSVELMRLMLRGRFGSGDVVIRAARFVDGQGRERCTFETGETLALEVEYETMRPVESLMLGVGIESEDGMTCSVAYSPEGLLPSPPPPSGTIRAELDSVEFLPGRYRVGIGLSPAGRPAEVYDLHLLLYLFRIEANQMEPPPVGVYRQKATFSVE